MLERHTKLISAEDQGNRTLSAHLRKLYFSGSDSLDNKIRQYTTKAIELSTISTEKGLSSYDSSIFSTDNTQHLLTLLDQVVSQYEAETKDRLDKLSTIESLILFTALLVLILELIFIFKPMEGVMRSTFMALEQAKEKATEAQKEAEKFSQAKSDFLANVSHEIRTPLNGIMGILSILKKSPLQEEQTQKINLALSSSNSLLKIVNDVLDFSKIEQEKIQIEIRNININPWCIMKAPP